MRRLFVVMAVKLGLAAVLALTLVGAEAIASPPSAEAHKRKATATRTAPATGDVWERLRKCESGGNYANKKNRKYRGAYQFSYATWRSVGGNGDPANASVEEQDMRAQMLQARSGWRPWPACSRRLGLR